ncbi:hypothetical protein NCAS_0F02380 [Naumovozyma castellii]|uniref:Signal recognition particle receptor subunit beta n=1 Tax=Naumovozyma castellii TaxID=27288 RepID=G0VGV1_NAUCA|nr:hypothetical protein NCAS_0F02380 [Naumovozyma castellii CBS 4309]CCC70722.1 hypothetical protein NCAS_0F02380 [Naumovozyma castellii CBS 4309]
MLSVTVLTAVLVVVLTTVYFLVQRKRVKVPIAIGQEIGVSNKKPVFVLAGPSNAGKTALFNMLVGDEMRNTVMSQEVSKVENVDDEFNLFDFPGHFKLRYKLFDQLKNLKKVSGVVFVVDSTVDPKELTKTAEFLLDVILVTESRKEDEIDILIACNKSELFSSRPPLKIKEALEREIDKIIVRKKKSLSDVKGKASSNDDDDEEMMNDNDNGASLEILNELGSTKAFKFSLLDGSVEAISGSVSKKNIDGWNQWIHERLSS